jgi:hypothetical protein
LFLVQARTFVILAFIVATALVTVAAQDATSQRYPEPAKHPHDPGLLADVPASAPPSEQEQGTTALNNMQGMQHVGMNMEMSSPSLLKSIEHHAADGTSVEPNSTPAPMLMFMKGDWSLMLHGTAFLNWLQETGPRGSAKVFSTNWVMGMAQRTFGPGIFTFRTMLSLEPATITGRRYPELFQQGEIAFGRPIVDGQHPHDFFMEIAALYDLYVGENTLLSFYFAPMGDPAMGPTAYPHRASAAENPLATLGHHLEDSTHIADDVVTVGLAYRQVRLEASGFHGGEPDEYRWNIDSGKIDSWSGRFAVNPAQNWSFQYSFGHLTSPEALHVGEDIQRMTASLMYNKPLRRGNWASTLLWGRNRSLLNGAVYNGYLAESTIRFAGRNYVWGRVENVDRTSDLLLGPQSALSGGEEHSVGRVQAYTVGYDREFNFIPHLAVAPGGQITLYGVPDVLKPLYGSRPAGVALFIRVRAH